MIAAVGRDAARKIGYPNAAALCGDLMSKFGKATKAGSYMSPATHQDVAATSRFASDLLPEALSPSPRLFMTQESMGSIVENDKQEGKQDEAHNTSSALEIASLCGALDDVLVGMAAGTCSSQIAIDMHDFIRKD